jgi:sodium-dependent dicarboxylate transporter 2/3/5
MADQRGDSAQTAPATVFILGVTFFVMIMTNLIMNVAAIAICLPVALKIAPYLGVGGEVILFGVAGGRRHALPAPRRRGAQRHRVRSKQFTSGEFFKSPGFRRRCC